jgi:hypothetical protein
MHGKYRAATTHRLRAAASAFVLRSMVCLLLFGRPESTTPHPGGPMIQRLRSSLFAREADPEDEPEETTPVFTNLRLFSANLLLSSGANATLYYLRSRNRRTAYAAGGPGAATAKSWSASLAAMVPFALGAAASTAQARHAVDPSPGRHTASTLLTGAVVGLGLAGAADAAMSAARGEKQFSLAPLLFGYAGLLGFLLDRQESVVAEEEEQLERRARIVERFVPKRKTRVDRIVVHV